MKETLKKIGKVIWTLLNSKIFYYVIIVGMFVFALNQCNGKHDTKVENTILQQNASADSAKIKLYETKNGELLAQKEIFIKSEKELKKENSDLYKLVKDQKGNIISLNSVVISLKQNEKELNDSINTLNKIIGEAVQLDKNRWMIPWELNYKWDATNSDHFAGQTFVSVATNPDGTFKFNPDGTVIIKHDDTKLIDRETKINLIFGDKVVDGKFNVYIQSAYPGFTAESMKGVFIDPNTNKNIQQLIKKDHWFTGFSLSIAITPGYNVISNEFGITVGPSLNYNIYSW